MWNKKKKKMVRLQCGGYDRTKIKPTWGEVAMSQMHCFTLDERFTTLYGHHFVMLNHFHHGRLVSFPFYLMSSLEDGIVDFRRNPRNPFLHEVLMLLIMEHIKANFVIDSHVLVKPRKSKKKEKMSGKCQIEEVEDDAGMKN